MTLTDQWVNENYNDLVKNYAGHWVLIKENEVVFADKNFEIVYLKAQELELSVDECVIRRIDSGDAVFYDIDFLHPKSTYGVLTEIVQVR